MLDTIKSDINKRQKTNKGFTIIEVLIVLAIVGLIMLIVFLAVPNLQRNARNTTIKNDVQLVLGGVGEFQGANSGKLPTAVATDPVSGEVRYTRNASNPTSIKVQGTTTVRSSANAPAAATPPLGEIQVSLGWKCSGGPANAPAPSPRAVASIYTIETSGGEVRLCQES